nr:zinc finger bed domain-containing protein ricesleeper 2 [Quercus suber]
MRKIDAFKRELPIFAVVGCWNQYQGLLDQNSLGELNLATMLLELAHCIGIFLDQSLFIYEIDDILHKIRKAIKYISETTIGKEKFQEVVKKLNLQSKDITSQGVPIRWDSTFFMLESALECREAFSYLQSSDCDSPVNLSMEEWDKAKVMHKCLIVFYDGICSFLGSKCLTTNVYFRKICDIHHNLIQWQKSEHTFIRSVAKKMSETFDKYFDYCTSVSAIAAVFDPRTKLDFVHYSFTELYGGHTKKFLLIDDALGHIFDEYAKGRSSQACTSYDDNYSDILNRWHKSKREMNKAHSQRAELHRYLEEPIPDFEGEFDILGWWHTNSTKFPTLWRIARDILAIPMSTSISNSAFSIETMTINPTFNGLYPDIIEALKDAPSTTNTKLMLANLSSTWSPQPFPTEIHGSSGNDAEAVKSCLRTMEFQYHDKVAKEMERAEYEAQLAAKEAQNRQDREQYAQEKFELEQRIKHLEVERQKLLFEANRDRQRNVLVPPNYGYPAPSSAPSSSSQLGVSNPRGSWHEGEGSYHHLDTTSDISHCPGLLYNSQNQGTSSLVTMDLVRANEFPKSPMTPPPMSTPPTTPPESPQMDQDFYQQLIAAYEARTSMF